jgi:hypothetical protein
MTSELTGAVIVNWVILVGSVARSARLAAAEARGSDLSTLRWPATGRED